MTDTDDTRSRAMALFHWVRRMTRRSRQAAPLTLNSGSGAPRGVQVKEREKLIRAVRDQELGVEARGRTIQRAGERPEDASSPGGSPANAVKSAGATSGGGGASGGGLVDFMIAGPGEPKLPDEVFPRLRWGGKFVYVGVSEHKVRRLAEEYDGKRGFTLESPVHAVRAPALGFRLPGLGARGLCFHARKTSLIQPGQFTERFTYDVKLAPAPEALVPALLNATGPGAIGGAAVNRSRPRKGEPAAGPTRYVVVKRVPEVQELTQRLRQKYPDHDVADLEKRARKLIEQVFPTFLTREAAILKLLQRDLPEPHRHKVPTCLDVKKDDRGFVRELTMNWLRIGGPEITQLQYARQAAELLQVIHDTAGIMHLDLRLDNVVITEDGVGFVDFGSAVRIGETIDRSPMLNTLFTEMMRTSQIQRMLGRMVEDGRVTSRLIADVHGKTDKTVDAFYLAVQVNKLHTHPELSNLVRYDPHSPEAKMLANLTAAILRPKNPHKAEFKTAADILRGIRRIEHRLAQNQPAPTTAAA